MKKIIESCKRWLTNKPKEEVGVSEYRGAGFIPHPNTMGGVFVNLQICHIKQGEWILENVRLRMDINTRFVGFSTYTNEKEI